MNSVSIHKLRWIVVLSLVALASAPGIAQAHVGVGPVHDVLHGFEHPLTGLDHLVAMLAVGIWATQLGGRAIWAVPLSFISAMTFGAIFGMAGAQLPLVEPWIFLSLLVLGLLIATATRLPLVVSAAMVGVFAVAHGYAHGTELPNAAAGFTYVLGFVTATAALHALGIGFGLLTKRLHAAQWQRLSGTAVAACGLYLLIG